MQNIERLTLDQIREFVEGSRTIGFTAPMREAVYEFIERVLKSQQYRRLSRGQKGIVRRFLVKMTGLSRAQLTRWIGRWMKTRRVQRKPVRPSFPRRYTAADIALLAGVDAAHEDLSGPAVRRVVKREHEVFGKKEYVRLAGISVSHQFGLEQLDSEFVIHASPTPHAIHRRKLLRVSRTRIRRAARRHCDPLQKSCSDTRWSWAGRVIDDKRRSPLYCNLTRNAHSYRSASIGSMRAAFIAG